MQSDTLEERYVIKFFSTWKNTATETYGMLQTVFRPSCMNSVNFTELRTTSFIESTGVACSDSVGHNRVQVLSIPVLLLGCSQDWTGNLQMIVSLEV